MNFLYRNIKQQTKNLTNLFNKLTNFRPMEIILKIIQNVLLNFTLNGFSLKVNFELTLQLLKLQGEPTVWAYLPNQ